MEYIQLTRKLDVHIFDAFTRLDERNGKKLCSLIFYLKDSRQNECIQLLRELNKLIVMHFWQQILFSPDFSENLPFEQSVFGSLKR